MTKQQKMRGCGSCAESDEDGQPSNGACQQCMADWDARAEEATDLEVDRLAGR